MQAGRAETTHSPSGISLGGFENAFSRGGNRVCFVHPQDPNLCVKVQRPDRAPEIKRAEKRFPKNLKPKWTFDDNLQELAVYKRITKVAGEQAWQLVPRCLGILDTDLGPGLCSELIRDDDQHISITLKQYVWQFGATVPLKAALEKFGSSWIRLGMPSRNLLVHNIVVQCHSGEPHRLWVIDGLGWPDILPVAYWIPALARRRATQRVAGLRRAIEETLKRKSESSDYGYHGWLNPEQRQQ